MHSHSHTLSIFLHTCASGSAAIVSRWWLFSIWLLRSGRFRPWCVALLVLLRESCICVWWGDWGMGRRGAVQREAWDCAETRGKCQGRGQSGHPGWQQGAACFWLTVQPPYTRHLPPLVSIPNSHSHSIILLPLPFFSPSPSFCSLASSPTVPNCTKQHWR